MESFLTMGASVCGLSNFHGLMGRNLVGITGLLLLCSMFVGILSVTPEIHNHCYPMNDDDSTVCDSTRYWRLQDI